MAEIPYPLKKPKPDLAIIEAAGLTRARAGYVAIGIVVAVALSLLLNLFVAPSSLKRDLTFKEQIPDRLFRDDGLVNPPDVAYGLYDPEAAPDGTFRRWTTERAAVTFPYIGNVARHVEVKLNMAGWREANQRPAQVTVRLNGQVVADFFANNQPKTYALQLDTRTMPNPYLDPSDLIVDIKSTTVPGADGKQRGVDLQWIELGFQRSPLEGLIEALVWGLSLGVLLLIASARMSVRWSLIYGLAALGTFVVLHLTYVPRAISSSVEVGLAGLAWAWCAALSPKRRPFVGLLLAAAGLWVVIGGRMLVDWEVDDSYISYRYAWNLVHGSGLVYNPGEQPVEGYTNFLWTMFAALGIWLGLPPGAFALMGTIACGICLLGLTYLIGSKLAQGKEMWPLLPVGLLALSACFITYGPKGSGLEAVPFALTVLTPLALIWVRESNQYLAWWRATGGIALAISAMTRPEGLLLTVLVLAVCAWQDYRAELPAWRLLLSALLPFLVLIVPYEVWRVTFYGYPFPNTFYAKTGTTFEVIVRGAQYSWSFFLSHWLLVLLALVGLAVTGTKLLKQKKGNDEGRRTKDQINLSGANLLVMLAILVIVFQAYIVVAGGDWANANRFFMPIAAPLALLAQVGVRLGLDWLRVARGRSLLLVRGAAAVVLVAAVVYCIKFELPNNSLGATFLAAVVAAYVVYVVLLRRSESTFVAGTVVALFAAYSVYALWLQRPDGYLATRTMRDTFKYQKWDLAALWIRDHTPPETVIATIPAGGMAYYSQRPVIDMLGLNDLHIGHLKVESMGTGVAGHEKRDPLYVFDKKPDYVLVFDAWYFGPLGGAFEQAYEQVTLRTATGYEIQMYKRQGAPEVR